MSDILTLETLDALCKAIDKYYSRPVRRIYLNPEDMWKAQQKMRALICLEIPENSILGIPVIVREELDSGFMILCYNDNEYMLVKISETNLTSK